MSKLEELQAQQAAIEKAILEEKNKGKKRSDRNRQRLDQAL